MGKTRVVELSPGPNGEERTTKMTNLEWALQYVKLKVQEMIFNGRKTDQCGVILFGSEETDNIISEKSGGYEHVSEYIPIAQPNAGTLAKLDALKPSEVSGDPIDALIVGIETQDVYLAKKKSWTRKIFIITDGENPIEIEDWEATVKKMNALDINVTVVQVKPQTLVRLSTHAINRGVDFDDEEFQFQEDDKSNIKSENEAFYHKLTNALDVGIIGTCAHALQDISRPEVKQVKSSLIGSVIRLGDVDVRPDEAIEVIVRASKCTALARPKSWKKFGHRETDEDAFMEGGDEDEPKAVFAQLKMRTEYYIDRSEQNADEEMKTEEEENEDSELGHKKDDNLEKVEKEQLVKGFKYGSTYAPCPDGQFPRLPTRKGIDICGFFPAKSFRRELSMGEVQYLWADPGTPQQQVALSSIVRAMTDKNVMAIARWVSKDGMDPKMGVLVPRTLDGKIDCLLWVQMPFADDVRKYTFAPLGRLVSKKGEVITKHPYLPTDEQQEAMDSFVDAMDLMDVGDKNEDGTRGQWFDTRLTYNPAIHRTKQALFHSAVVNDIATNPLDPPHPELLIYMDPPKRAVKRARDAVEECKRVFKIKEVPKKAPKTRKDGHVHAQEDDGEELLLDRKAPTRTQPEGMSQITAAANTPAPSKPAADSDSETEDEEEELLLVKKPGPSNHPLPTPARSLSPPVDPGRAPGRIIGSTYPLKDFKKNIAQGDVVTKAVEDLGFVIQEIVMKPFSSRRHKELLECMKALRDVCLKEDEIDAWNVFLRDLKKSCSNDPGNPEFWSEIQKLGRSISLISTPEAAKLGGESDVPENAAEVVSLAYLSKRARIQA
ncbi:SPOC like C-terminal domain-containing protein [Hygrophoropsis aurantiaca]|uniref:SPOC like C-terminal domain-containing protein n=1 Tax=Hygrophoropsis aurantiaca TaxID=72124 RepID=A0ACB8A562_9AGAM|nr:SPOC like C-terminal domain-containing protein [Hygrophoropsis aurantiaca]